LIERAFQTILEKSDDLHRDGFQEHIPPNSGLQPTAALEDPLAGTCRSDEWRVRLLPESGNAQAGYNIHENIIRYNSNEKGIAQTLLADLRTKLQIEVNATEIAYPTPNYVSVFFCAQ
jgi:hypothetical protein